MVAKDMVDVYINFRFISMTLIYLIVDCAYDVQRCSRNSLNCEKDEALIPSMLRCSNPKIDFIEGKRG